MIEFIKVNSITDLLGEIKNLKEKYGYKTEFGDSCPIVNGRINPNAEFWYRGMSNEDYKLRPKVMRDGQYFVQNYDEPLKQFTKESSVYLSEICKKDKLLWMEYAQHFGVPTRLLDFTTNPLTALYFACNSNFSKDGQLWVINEFNYQKVVAKRYCNDKKISEIKIENLIEIALNSDNNCLMLPATLSPSYIDARMNAQSSRFLLWPNTPYDLDKFITDDLMMNNQCSKNDNLIFAYKFIVPKESKHQILRDLDLLGVNDKMLFPGLDGIGSYIDFLYRQQ